MNSKEVLLKIIGAEKLPICIEKLTDEGDITFSLDLRVVGLKTKDFENDPIYETRFFVNFLGEYITRQNIKEFARILTDIAPAAYEDVVCGYNHSNFGVDRVGTHEFRFTMHMSLVQSILTEELKKIID